jgi:hypothetical protein
LEIDDRGQTTENNHCRTIVYDPSAGAPIFRYLSPSFQKSGRIWCFQLQGCGQGQKTFTLFSNFTFTTTKERTFWFLQPFAGQNYKNVDINKFK